MTNKWEPSEVEGYEQAILQIPKRSTQASSGLCLDCTTPIEECKWILHLTPYEGQEITARVVLPDARSSTQYSIYCTTHCPFHNQKSIPEEAKTLPPLEKKEAKIGGDAWRRGEKRIFVFGQFMTRKECADMVGVHENTIGFWIKKYGKEEAGHRVELRVLKKEKRNV